MVVKKHLPYKFDVDISGFKLPDDFLFGACNSPYHSEGYYNEEGFPFNQWGEWELENKVEKSGLANNFWNNYISYINKAKDLGLNALRMGFDWSRVQPTYKPEVGPEPPFDYSAFDHYAEIVSAVYAAGLEPVVTIYHFVQPSWVGPSLWIEDDLIKKFMNYAITTVREVNTRLVKMGYPAIRFWVTINEPSISPQVTYLICGHPHDPARVGIVSALKNHDNIIASHLQLYDLIHDMYKQEGWRLPHVGFNVVANSLYEFDKCVYDLCRAREFKVGYKDLEKYFEERRLDFYNYYNKIADRRLGATSSQRLFYENSKHESMNNFNPMKHSRAIETLYSSKKSKKMDYAAINIYDPFVISGIYYEKEKKSEVSAKDTVNHLAWWEWVHEKKAYEEHIELFGRETLGLPLYILEAGIAHYQEKFGRPKPRPDGLTRIQFLKESLSEIIRGIQKGYPLMGYFYWTLCDNYEWGSYTTRLGLLEYDFKKNIIKNTDGFSMPTGETFKNLIEVMQSGEKNQIKKAFGSL